MKIYTIKNGQNCGPYTRSEIAARIQSGEYDMNDLCWFEGCKGGVSLAQAIGEAKVDAPAVQAQKPSDAELIYLAIEQKSIIWLAVAYVVLAFTPLWPSAAGTIMAIFYAVHIIGVVFCFLVARTLRKNVWLWGLLALVPLLNLFAYARMVSQAAKKLNDNGIPTGVFGASSQEISKRKRASVE